MIRLKDPRKLIYSGFQVCEVDPCENESEKIWASSEIRIIDICQEHYDEVKRERFNS